MTKHKAKREGRELSLVRRDEQPEDALWRTVIVQAISDATIQLPDHRSAFHERMELVRGEARRWFKQQTADFRRVCELAGLEHRRVHAFAMAQIRKAMLSEQLQIREALAKQHQQTAEFLTSTMPGVVKNFQMEGADRPARTARDGEKIEFSSQIDVSAQNQTLNASTSGEIAAAAVEMEMKP